MTDRIGPTPVPADAELVPFLLEMIGEDRANLDEHLEELRDTVVYTNDSGEPEVFAYARLINFLGRRKINRTYLIHLCAAAMWRIDQLNNLPQADLRVIETDKGD